MAAVYLKFSSPENSWKVSAVLKTSEWPHHLHKDLEKQPNLQVSTTVTEANIKRMAGNLAHTFCEHLSQKAVVILGCLELRCRELYIKTD